MLDYSGKTCTVSGFSSEFPVLQDIPIITGAVAYDHPSGEVLIIVLNEFLHIGGKMEHTLVCPNQVRANGVIVDDIPIHLAADKSTATHSIYFKKEDTRLQLELRGCISYLPTRYPSESELNECQWLHLTSANPWNPYSESFNDDEVKARQMYSATTRDPAYRTSPIGEIGNINNEIISNVLQIFSTSTTKRTYGGDVKKIAKIFGIGEKMAEATINATTQLGRRTVMNPITRRFRTQQSQLKYNRLQGDHGRFYSDTFFAKVKTSRDNSAGQIFVNNAAFIHFVPLKTKAQAGEALGDFITHFGIPSALMTDGASEQRTGKWEEWTKKCNIVASFTEPHSPWQNRAEGAIREFKKSVRRLLFTTKTPMKLWDYCGQYIARLRRCTSQPLYCLDGRTPHELLTGETPDISELLDYEWYSPVWYYDGLEGFPLERRKLGRWLGPSHRIGQALCYYIIRGENGRILSRTTVQPLTDDEMADSATIEQIKEMDECILKRLNGIRGDKEDMDDPDKVSSLFTPQGEDGPSEEDEAPFPEESTQDAEDTGEEGEDLGDSSMFDKYLGARVMVSKGTTISTGVVTGRKKDRDGNPIGIANSNPLLDTRGYEVEFDDGHTEEYQANVIAESMYAQADPNGHHLLILDEIIDHRKDGRAVALDDINAGKMAIKRGSRGNPAKRRTTRGWQLLVQWKHGETQWIDLKDMKESYPVAVAEYAVSNKIAFEPAFSWWVHHTIKKKDRIIAKVRSKYWDKTHKYGIRLPRSMKEALQIDAETGTDFWRKAIEKEMGALATAECFRFLETGERPPIGYKWIKCHMIFDVKFDFTRKARFVAGGHMTNPTSTLTYSSVVSRESIRLAFLIAALNDLDILAADIGNAYIQAPCREKVYFTAGPEFGPLKQGKTVVIVQALYGLKSSGAAWHAKFAESLWDMGFVPSKADPDVWMKPEVKETGEPYYAYILVYVDDILVLSVDPSVYMNTISKLYTLKKGSVEKPRRYLGADIREWRFDEDTRRLHWAQGAKHYIKNAVSLVEEALLKEGMKLVKAATTPFSSGYRSEMDVSAVLDEKGISTFQTQLGVLRWIVEIGRIDIMFEVTSLSRFLIQPRKGHLEQVYRIFAYLKSHINGWMVFDSKEINIDDRQFTKEEWYDFYPDAKEEIPYNAPKPRGRAVQMSCFVDADHAGDRVTRRSYSGAIIFVNNSPITWLCKRQNTVETSTFGSEYIAMRMAIETIEGLRYKLRMFGVKIEGSANVFCDNESVIKNSTMPESRIKKKHNSIAYHKTRESVAAGIIRIAYVASKDNIADIFTKSLTAIKRIALLSAVMYITNQTGREAN